MMNKRFRPGDNVLVLSSNKKKWIKAKVVGEKFNGGNGGFYTIEYINSSHSRVMPSHKLVPFILIQQVNHAGKVV